MATLSTVVHQPGTPLIFGDSATHAPASGSAQDMGAVNVEMDLTGVADGDAYQSAKFDFGEDRALTYFMQAAFELAATAVVGDVIEVHLAPSFSGTAAVGNAGGVSGVDEDYTGTAAATVTESLPQLLLIGSFICTDDATGAVQVAKIGKFSPPERFGSLVLVNRSGADFHSDVVETSIRISEIDTATID